MQVSNAIEVACGLWELVHPFTLEACVDGVWGTRHKGGIRFEWVNRGVCAESTSSQDGKDYQK
jgi:hypothetical protein